jgi:hypothetical protein
MPTHGERRKLGPVKREHAAHRSLFTGRYERVWSTPDAGRFFRVVGLIQAARAAGRSLGRASSTGIGWVRNRAERAESVVDDHLLTTQVCDLGADHLLVDLAEGEQPDQPRLARCHIRLTASRSAVPPSACCSRCSSQRSILKLDGVFPTSCPMPRSRSSR